MIRQRLFIPNRMLFGCTLLLVICGCAMHTGPNKNRSKHALPGSQSYIENFSWPSDVERTVSEPATTTAPSLPIQPPEWPAYEQLTQAAANNEWRYGNIQPDEPELAAVLVPAASQYGDQPYDRPPAPAPIISATYPPDEPNNYQPAGSWYPSTNSSYDGDWVPAGSPVTMTGEVSEVSYSTYPAGAAAISSLSTAETFPIRTSSQLVNPTPPPEPVGGVDDSDETPQTSASADDAAALAAEKAAAEARAAAKEKADAEAAAAAAAAKDDGLADASIRLDYEGEYVVDKSRSVVLSVGYGLNQTELAEQVQADLARLGHVDGQPLTDDLRLNPAAVTAELTGDAGAFKITSGPNKTRALLFGKPNQWQWDVKPLLEGPQQLTLTLSWPLPGATDGKPQVFQRAYQVSVSVDAETFWGNLVDKITEHSKKLTAMFVALLALLVAIIKMVKTIRSGKENG